jgi:predicted O-linked N-acetylglucosamine transferase (SPINDLY family)
MTRANNQRALETAYAHFQAGRFADAEAIYRQVLAKEPNNADALHLLGALASAIGRHEEAVALVRRALSLQPLAAPYFVSLGFALGSLGKLETAAAAYRNALALDPRNLEAMNNLGTMLHQLGRFEEAIKIYRQALAINPAAVDFHYNLGNSLRESGDLNAATTCFKRAIELQPDFAPAHHNLGTALAMAQQWEQSAAEFARTLALRPDFVDVYGQLGLVYMKLGRVDDAIAVYRRGIALAPDRVDYFKNLADLCCVQGEWGEVYSAYKRTVELRPDVPEHHFGLGLALQKIHRADEAITTFRTALALRPDYPQALTNLGSALFEVGALDEAIANTRRSIELNPSFAESHYNLGNYLSKKGDMDGAIACTRKALEIRPDYFDAANNLSNCLKDVGQIDGALELYGRAAAMNPRLSEAHSNRVYSMHYHPGYDTRAICEELARWNALHAALLAGTIQPHLNDPSPDRRIRVGYVSPDFCEHVIGWNLLPLLSHHDHKKFEIFCFSSVVHSDAMTEKLKADADVWRNLLDVKSEDAASMIRQDKIDILVDLSLHTAANRLLLFARKPAPVQVTYLGYCGSTGLKAIDYRFSDCYLDPPELDQPYAEKTICLPNTYWCYQPGWITPEVNALPALSAGHITFGCLNNFAKVSDSAVRSWARILGRVPGSKLILNAPHGSGRDRILQIIPQDRVEFVPKRGLEEYMLTYQRLDIALDAFPYGGAITSCDALWMGVPVVTLEGRTAVGRGGKSILYNLGLKEFVAKTPGEYEQIAVDLAKDTELLSNLRGELRGKMKSSPLMDAAGFAKDVENAYRQMWRKWCEDQGTRS